jgi:hypothetical protein
VVETALDKLAQTDQQLDELISQAIRMPEDEDSDTLSMILPSAANRASKSVGFTSTGAVTVGADSTFVPWVEFDTIALLQANASTYSNNTRARVSGYVTAGQGDAGPDFYLDTSDTTSTDDGGSVIVDAASQRWKRKFRTKMDVRWWGAVGDNSTDDFAVFDAIATYLVSNQVGVHISEGQYVLSDKWTITRSVDISCDRTASMRFTSTNAANCGIELDYENGSDTLCHLSFPQLFSSVFNSGSYSIPGYSSGDSWAYDLTSRVGSAVHLKGGNRIHFDIQYANGWTNGFKLTSSSASTCDNIKGRIGVLDFCEKGIHIDSGPSGTTGMATVDIRANTVWAKFPLYFTTTYGYVTSSRFEIDTAIINEDGGSVVYGEGDKLRSSSIRINLANAGLRADSTTTPAQTADLVCPYLGGDQVSGNVHTGTAQAGGSNTLTLATTASSVDDAYNGLELELTGGTGSPETQTISDYDGTTKVATIDTTWAVTPDATTTYSVPIAYDGMGTSPNIAYFGATHCDIKIGAYHDHVGSDLGSGSPIPAAGDTIRVRDAGRLNHIEILYSQYETSGTNTAIDTTTSVGEANYNSGVGGAQFAKCVYSKAALSALAAGASQTHYIYHQLAGADGFRPFTIAYKSETAVDDQIRMGAFQTGTTNREVKVRIENEGASPFTGDIYFWLIVE